LVRLRHMRFSIMGSSSFLRVAVFVLVGQSELFFLAFSQ
jgi:hypothetical protein